MGPGTTQAFFEGGVNMGARWAVDPVDWDFLLGEVQTVADPGVEAACA
jgi:hypothetical protein